MGAMKTFRELLYEEEGIATNEEKVKELMSNMEYENINIENVHEYHRNMVQKIIRIFIDTRGFTKEPEDSESEDSPASYELENSSEEELEIIIGDKSWKFSELKRRTSSIDEDQLRYIWKIGIKLMIEMDILVTKTFIDKVQEIEEIDEREKELKIREWECIKEMQKDEQDELAELKDEIEKLGYEIDVSKIQRMKSFGVNNRILITEEFIMEYMGIIELEDKELRREIHKWLNENTTWCERCEIRWMNNMFRFGRTVCKDCEEEDVDEIDDRVKRLQKIFEDIGTIVTEEELLRLTSMGYTDGEILDKEFIEIFQENKNESEKELKKKLDKLLKEQAGIIDSEESGEKSDNEESEEDNTDDSEKTGEILSPDEIWDENIENFNEEEFEDEIENVINRGDIDLSQNSDTNSSLNIKNSDNESELSDYNLQDLFQENMATENQVKRLIENALGYPANTLNAAVGAGASLIDRIENAGNEAGGMVSVPLFYGKEDEDVNDWVRQFEVAFTAVGKAAGANGVRQAAYAVAHLRGAASQWYNEMKEVNAGLPVSTKIDIGRDDNRQNMFTKPLNENYEDELVKAFEEKARISKLEGLVSNIERRLNNDNNRYRSNMGRRLNDGNRDSYQSNQKRVPTCYTCGRVGHYSRECPEKRRNARVNMMDEYDDQEEYDYNGYEDEEPQYGEMYYTQGYYDDYEDRELNYYNELYAKDNAVKGRRQTRRTSPIVGYKNNNEEGNLQEELREAGNRIDDREIPSGTTTPRYTPERTEQNNVHRDSQNWDNPIGPENYNYGRQPMTKDGRFYKPMFTREGKVFYPGMRQDESGNWARTKPSGSGKPREYGLRLTDEIPPYDIVGDVKNCRANITFGQLTNENTKYHRQLREGTYKPRSVNERN
ncbi:unnamed protein product [Rhizophagus irregularis]|nr:unnamed protein product [Rhizophagus irregularis]